MKGKLFLFGVLVTAVCGRLQAQTVIMGTVTDTHGRGVSEAYVTASAKGKSGILGYANTDGKGTYRLEFKSLSDSVVVTVAGLSIGRETKAVANRSQQLDLHVKEQHIVLEEVSVRAQKIRQQGDTLSYNVAAYRQQGDRVIGDVLKRMPGIEVSGNGSIKFNGKSIRKFYVEDMDLLQGRYGLATDNINAQDVATVQVLQNHQPVKALQGRSLTDDVAINLKLKDSGKGTVAINAMLGAGGQLSGGWGIGARPLSDGTAPIGRNPLWAAELVGMYFPRQRQNMTLYKGNNTGNDVSKELTSHYSSINSVGLYPFCPTDAVMPPGSGLPQKRNMDNHSHILTTNHLEKLDKDTEITLNVAYHHDRIRREGTSEANYFLSDSQRLLSSETLTSLTSQHNLSGNLRYCRNAENGFTANVLQFDGGWNSDDVSSRLSSGLTGMAPADYGDNRVSQHFHHPSLSVSNTLNTLRNFGKHTLDLHFSVGYAQRPNTLTVDVDSLQQGTSAYYNQDLTSRNIAANAQYRLPVSSRSLLAALRRGGQSQPARDKDRTRRDCTSHGRRLPRQNDLWYNTYEVALSRYERHDWSGSVNASYHKNVGDPGGIYSGYVMNNYRSFQRSYVEQLAETDRVNVGVTLAYRNAVGATFLRVNANYSHTRDNQIYGYEYHGATSVVQAIDRNTTSDSYHLGFDGSKGFDWMQATIRSFAGYGYSQSERLIARELYPFHSRTVSIGAGGTVTPLPWFNIVLSSGYAWNVSETDGGRQDMAQTVRTATQRLSLNFYVTRQITLTASAEDNYNNLTAKNRHAWFGDLSAKYKLRHVDLELQANNLFNQKQYTRVNYSGLDIHTQTSQLRPMNIVGTIRFNLL